jgi:hypothetical protein
VRHDPKACFDRSALFNTLPEGAIVTANEDEYSLLFYTDADSKQITVNGEIDKLASKIGQSRDFAGIHWRSDYERGRQLGEAAAISVLRDQINNSVSEAFTGGTITEFDGTTIAV